MLENYEVDNHGVIHQISRKPFIYDPAYVDTRYKSIPDLVTNMSYLRLGYIYNSINNISSLLDVGFGSGDFLQVAKSIVPSLAGYDVFYNDNLPENVYRETDLISNYYHVITFFDSLEHFDSLDFVKKLKCDFIVISVPWCHYYNDLWFADWKHRRPDEHLHHFDIFSLTGFMRASGFKLLTYSNVEDSIRGLLNKDPNILTAIYKKKYE